MKLIGKKSISVLMVCILMFGLLAACSQSSGTNNGSNNQAGNTEKEVITIRIGAGAPIESSVWLQPIRNYFMPEVDRALESTNYEIRWIENWGTIGTMAEELKMLESGLLDVGFSTAAFQPAHLRISSMGFNTPFSSNDPEIIAEVAVRMMNEFDEFKAEYDAVNTRLLGFSISENYSLITNFPIETLDDMKGKKIAGASANQRWLAAAGATPVQGSLNEAYQSLQSGVYNGFVVFTSSMMGFKLYEQANYLTNVSFGSMNLGGLVVNNDAWNKLPTEVQTVFEEVGEGFTYTSAKYAKEAEQANFKKMEEVGVNILELSPEQESMWAEKLTAMPQDYANELNKAGLPGTELMKAFIQYQIDAGHEFPFPYEIQ